MQVSCGMCGAVNELSGSMGTCTACGIQINQATDNPIGLELDVGGGNNDLFGGMPASPTGMLSGDHNPLDIEPEPSGSSAAGSENISPALMDLFASGQGADGPALDLSAMGSTTPAAGGFIPSAAPNLMGALEIPAAPNNDPFATAASTATGGDPFAAAIGAGGGAKDPFGNSPAPAAGLALELDPIPGSQAVDPLTAASQIAMSSTATSSRSTEGTTKPSSSLTHKQKIIAASGLLAFLTLVIVAYTMIGEDTSPIPKEVAATTIQPTLQATTQQVVESQQNPTTKTTDRTPEEGDDNMLDRLAGNEEEATLSKKTVDHLDFYTLTEQVHELGEFELDKKENGIYWWAHYRLATEFAVESANIDLVAETEDIIIDTDTDPLLAAATLGGLYLDGTQRKKIKRALKVTQKYFKKSARVQFILGVNSKNAALSRQYLRSAIKLKPNFTEAKLALAQQGLTGKNNSLGSKPLVALASKSDNADTVVRVIDMLLSVNAYIPARALSQRLPHIDEIELVARVRRQNFRRIAFIRALDQGNLILAKQLYSDYIKNKQALLDNDAGLNSHDEDSNAQDSTDDTTKSRTRQSADYLKQFIKNQIALATITDASGADGDAILAQTWEELSADTDDALGKEKPVKKDVKNAEPSDEPAPDEVLSQLILARVSLLLDRTVLLSSTTKDSAELISQLKSFVTQLKGIQGRESQAAIKYIEAMQLMHQKDKPESPEEDITKESEEEFEKKKKETILDFLLEAIKLDGNLVAARLQYIMISSGEEINRSYLARLRQLEKLSKNGNVALVYASAMHKSGHMKKGLSLLRTLLWTHPLQAPSVLLLTQWGRSLADTGHYERGKSILETLYETHEGDEPLIASMIEIAERVQDHSALIKWQRVLVEAAPKESTRELILAKRLNDAEDFANSRPILIRLLKQNHDKRDPHSHRILIELGRAWAQRDEIKARGYLIDARSIKRTAEVLFLMGDVDERRGKKDTAADSYEEALKIDPKMSQARTRLVRILIAQEHYNRSEEHLRILLKEDPNNIEAAVMLGDLLRNDGKEKKAIKYYLKAAKLAKTVDPALLLKIAQIQLGQLGQIRQAVKTLEELLAFNEKDTDALHMIGFAMKDLGRKKESINYLERFLELTPNKDMVEDVETTVKDLKTQ